MTENLGLALVDRAFLSKALIQLPADGWDCASLPTSCLACGNKALESKSPFSRIDEELLRGFMLRGIFLACC